MRGILASYGFLGERPRTAGDMSKAVIGAMHVRVLHSKSTLVRSALIAILVTGIGVALPAASAAAGTVHVHGRTGGAPQAEIVASPNIFTTKGFTAYNPDEAAFDVSGTTNQAEIASAEIDFGDGSSEAVTVPHGTTHSYPGPGTYTATLTVTDLADVVSTSSSTITVGDEYTPMIPVRAYDSRGDGTDHIAAHSVVRLSLAQLRIIDSSVDSVSVTVTVTNAKASGYVTVYPGGTARPTGSTLNFLAGKTVANETNTLIGTDGSADFYNGSSGPIDLIVDTIGFTTTFQFGDTYSPVNPVRVLDTRTTTGGAEGPVHGGTTVTLPISGHNGVPAGATAAVLNVATTNTSTSGHLIAYADGDARPSTSNSNWAAGMTVSNLVVVPMIDGKVVLYNSSTASVSFVADLVGYYNRGGTAAVYLPHAPTRVLDTRNGTGTGTVAKLGPGRTLKLQIVGHDGIVTGTSAVALNLTETGATASGYLAAYPDGISRSAASSVNFSTGRTVANMTIMRLGSDGAIEIYNSSSRSVDVIADLIGTYYSYPSN
jgi:hypothetical protein